jgi:hypothetical protein
VPCKNCDVTGALCYFGGICNNEPVDERRKLHDLNTAYERTGNVEIVDAVDRTGPRAVLLGKGHMT